jgi:hypothetical protein
MKAAVKWEAVMITSIFTFASTNVRGVVLSGNTIEVTMRIWIT